MGHFPPAKINSCAPSVTYRVRGQGQVLHAPMSLRGACSVTKGGQPGKCRLSAAGRWCALSGHEGGTWTGAQCPYTGACALESPQHALICHMQNLSCSQRPNLRPHLTSSSGPEEAVSTLQGLPHSWTSAHLAAHAITPCPTQCF